MIDFSPLEVWFITGSQHLYGPETLRQVESNSRAIVDGLNGEAGLPVKLVFKPVVKTPDEINAVMLEANSASACVGLVAWMHTFSPAKMWIGGLTALKKPLCHLHTQFNRDIPWSTIDMDYMNLNQSAHGDREFGFICSRCRIEPQGRGRPLARSERSRGLGAWMRAAAAWHDLRHMKIARLGDNMRQVAVTEGDKVEAEIRFGFSVNGYGLGDLVKFQDQVTDAEVDTLCAEYASSYALMKGLEKGGAGTNRSAMPPASSWASAPSSDGDFQGFTDTFENLHGLKQLPGIASQRLMADGYGFGAEGDWKHAALVRVDESDGARPAGGTSFMEDYTYHLDPAGPRSSARTCWKSARRSPMASRRCEIHPLGIGGKEDPVRLVFDVAHRRCRQRLDRRHGQPLPHDREYGEGHPAAREAAQAAGRPRRVDPRARPRGRRGRLDLCRRRPPHRLFAGVERRAPRRLRRHGRHRVPAHRPRNQAARIQERAALERGGLHGRPGASLTGVCSALRTVIGSLAFAGDAFLIGRRIALVPCEG